jgi:putative ABC transport system substrate-binding protein
MPVRGPNRRTFIAALGGAAAWPIVARAQQGTEPVIGFLNPATAMELAPRVAAFREGLNQLGFIEGKNVGIEYRWGQGQADRVPELAADLVRHQVAVIAATGGTGGIAKTATSTIPIVFTEGGDPVAMGLVASLGRPSGNVTGITLLSAPIVSKRIDLLHDLIPNAKGIAVLLDTKTASSEFELSIANQAANGLGWQVRALRVNDAREFDRVFQNLPDQHTDAVLVTTNPVFESRRDQIISLAAKYSMPAIYALREYPVVGGLLSYGASIADVYRQAGLYVAKILRGETPADLPVMLPTKFELVINLKTAKALGLTVPPSLLARADEVIE